MNTQYNVNDMVYAFVSVSCFVYAPIQGIEVVKLKNGHEDEKGNIIDTESIQTFYLFEIQGHTLKVRESVHGLKFVYSTLEEFKKSKLCFFD